MMLTSPIHNSSSRWEVSQTMAEASSQSLRKAEEQAFAQIGSEIPEAKKTLNAEVSETWDNTSSIEEQSYPKWNKGRTTSMWQKKREKLNSKENLDDSYSRDRI